MKEFYEGVFNYCFLVNFKSKLCKKLIKSIQNRKKVRDFIQDLQSLTQRFSDITPR